MRSLPPLADAVLSGETSLARRVWRRQQVGGPLPAPVCSSLFITDDATRLEPWGNGLRLLARGRNGGLSSEPALSQRLLVSRDVGAVVLVHGTCVGVVVPPRCERRRAGLFVAAIEHLLRVLSPALVVLAAPGLWGAPGFGERLAPTIARRADRVITGKRGINLGTAAGLGEWSLLVAVLAGSEAKSVAVTWDAVA